MGARGRTGGGEGNEPGTEEGLTLCLSLLPNYSDAADHDLLKAKSARTTGWQLQVQAALGQAWNGSGEGLHRNRL